jgi:hypothetical protein
MKKHYILFALLLLTRLLNAQNFEGEIVYTIKFKCKLPNITDEQFNAMMGSEMKFQVKDGNYRNTYNGALLQYQLYINKDNKVYNKFSNSEQLLWKDGSTPTDETLKSAITKNVTEVLGYTCDEVVLTTKAGEQKYYFNRALGMDAKLYTHHNLDNWFDYLSTSNAVPLKLHIETSHYTLEAVATEIKRTPLDNKIFELPVGVTTTKSPN